MKVSLPVVHSILVCVSANNSPDISRGLWPRQVTTVTAVVTASPAITTETLVPPTGSSTLTLTLSSLVPIVVSIGSSTTAPAIAPVALFNAPAPTTTPFTAPYWFSSSMRMLDQARSCSSSLDPSHFPRNLRKEVGRQLTNCMYQTCMSHAATACAMSSRRQTNTIHWNGMSPMQTQEAINNLALVRAEPRFPVPPPWLNVNRNVNNSVSRDYHNRYGNLNWTDRIFSTHVWDEPYYECRYSARDFGQMNRCDNELDCDRRCANFVGFKDPVNKRKMMMVAGSILGALVTLALLAGCCICCKRRVPRSRIPRQPTVHEPTPASEVVQTAPRVVEQTPPTVRTAEVPSGRPSVVENVEHPAGQPTVVETPPHVVETAPAPATAPAQANGHH